MALSMEQMRVSLRKLLGGLDTTDLSDSAANLLLNESYWEILDKFPFREKEASSTFSFVVGQRLYTAPSPFEAVTKIVIFNPADNNYQHIVLKRMTIEWYENEYNSNPASTGGTPEWYLRRDSGFYVFPTPDLVYSGIIYYNTVLDDLTGTDVPPIPQVWHEIIKFGAAYRGWQELGDLNRANYFRNQQIGLMDSTEPVEAKEEEDSPYAGVEVPPELTGKQW